MTARIVELARRQHGVVSWAQLRELGVTRHQVHGRHREGWLLRLHRGVYALAGRPLAWRGRWMGAVLACGGDAVLSHASAAALWRLAPPTQGRIEVTVPGQIGRTGSPIVILHRSSTLTIGDAQRHDGIPVTSPRRTIVDMARAGAADRRLERLIDEAERLRLLDPTAFGDAARHQGRPLPVNLRSLLARHEAGSTLTRSELEERFLSLCRARGLPAPLVNAELLGLTVDFLWPRAGLAVEVDGRGSHDTRRGFQDDRDRDSLLVASGFRPMRFTWWDVTSRPELVAHRIRRALESVL